MVNESLRGRVGAQNDMTYYFVNVPKLPKELSHQSGTVELVEYAVRENKKVEKNQTVAVVRNRWAKIALKAVGPGYVSKIFFQKGTQVKEGDPFAIIVCDPEAAPSSKETSEIEVIEHIRQKPNK